MTPHHTATHFLCRDVTHRYFRNLGHSRFSKTMVKIPGYPDPIGNYLARRDSILYVHVCLPIGAFLFLVSRSGRSIYIISRGHQPCCANRVYVCAQPQLQFLPGV